MVMIALGFGCGAGSQGMQVCNGSVRIGSTTTASANVVISADGILQRIDLTIPTSSFDKVAPALVEKYGPPDRESSPTLQNGFGVQFQQTQLEWKAKSGVALLALRYDGSVTDSLVSFTTRSDRLLRSNPGQARASDL